MFGFSILFALAMPNGSVKGLDLPSWFGYIFYPLAVICILYALRKKAGKNDKKDDDKPDE
jgi:hypothetical protein